MRFKILTILNKLFLRFPNIILYTFISSTTLKVFVGKKEELVALKKIKYKVI